MTAPNCMRLLCLLQLTLTLVSLNVVAQEYDKATCVAGAHIIPNDENSTYTAAPDTFYVEWSTTASDNTTIVLEVVREWSPNGADRFYKLVNDNYYNCAAFFRVVPGKLLLY
jgi:Cyclophilin type peptidyl-prolyl cis-trans isomerase/CLD